MTFDRFENVGKCDTCSEHKHLDEMVRKENVKGVYECKDCHSETVFFNYTESVNISDNHTMSKVNKLLRWCFG